jgi:ribosomal protein S18 acetylase RimI-like enzyme
VGGARVAIRTASGDDAALLADLGARTFRDTFAADNTAADMAAYLAAAFAADVQAGEIADPASAFLIAQVDGVTAGYARLRWGDAPRCVPGIRRMEIARFYAETQWIGSGIGAALMRACLGEAAALGCDVVWLDVWERNARAIAFYSKWGFSVVGGQDFVLGEDLQHDLLMVRSAV